MYKKYSILILSVLTLSSIILFFYFDNPLNLLGQYYLLTGVAFIAAAFANATALGGGFLFIPIFIFIYGLGAISALKLTLATQAFGMTSGSFGWSRDHIITKVLLFSLLGSIPGMLVGTFIYFPEGDFIKKVFAIISLIVGIALVLEMKYGSNSRRKAVSSASNRHYILFTLICFFVGVINAWVAIAVGEAVVLWLLFVDKVRMEKAVATGVAALAICSIVGFAFHAVLGGILWNMLIFTAPGVIIGGYTGAKLGRYLEQYVLEKKQKKAFKFSPLKVIFTLVLFVDGIVILLSR